MPDLDTRSNQKTQAVVPRDLADSIFDGLEIFSSPGGIRITAIHLMEPDAKHSPGPAMIVSMENGQEFNVLIHERKRRK